MKESKCHYCDRTIFRDEGVWDWEHEDTGYIHCEMQPDVVRLQINWDLYAIPKVDLTQQLADLDTIDHTLKP